MILQNTIVKNRPKGTIVTKPIASVNKDIVREMILRNLIPAIKRKMPLTRKNNILYIQKDNSKPHLYNYCNYYKKIAPVQL